MAAASCKGCSHLTAEKRLKKAYTGRVQETTLEKCLKHNKYFVGTFAQKPPTGCHEGGKE